MVRKNSWTWWNRRTWSPYRYWYSREIFIQWPSACKILSVALKTLPRGCVTIFKSPVPGNEKADVRPWCPKASQFILGHLGLY